MDNAVYSELIRLQAMADEINAERSAGHTGLELLERQTEYVIGHLEVSTQPIRSQLDALAASHALWVTLKDYLPIAGDNKQAADIVTAYLLICTES